MVDISGASLGLALLFPLMILIGCVLKFTSNGPLIFSQDRVGYRCKVFKIYKFRTMVIDANLLGGFQTKRNDPRVTKFGKFLRLSSLDELPQLFNVLFGDMSLVGPRPNVLSQRSKYTAENWSTRHSVKPGITGLAQISGRSDCDFEKRLALDLYYAKNYNFILDFKIMCKTFSVIANLKNAN